MGNAIGNIFSANVKKLRSDWMLIKSLISEEIEHGNYEVAIKILEKACHLAYTYNFVIDYWDVDIERFIQNISFKLRSRVTDFKETQKNRIVFYDYFVYENRGFTQQYLKVFFDTDIEFLYIIKDSKKYNKENIIIKSIECQSNGKIVVLNSTSTYDQYFELQSIISDFKPSKIFFHVAPWEILSCCLAFRLQNDTEIKCYLLNITDHTFWPGISCFEYIIEYRSYGKHYNHILKGKPLEKLIVLQTPSFENVSIPFQGFPTLTDGKVIGFSGGSYYKIVDEKSTFLSLIKELLISNPNFVFLFANIGGEKPLRKYIKENNLEQQFILIGNRRDISEVFKRIDIYFNTFPYSGGLMLQYALSNNKPFIALAHPGLHNSRVDLVFDCELSEEYIIFDYGTYLKIATKLINDKTYRQNYLAPYSESKAAINNFAFGLQGILNGFPPTQRYESKFEINQAEVTDYHIKSQRLQGIYYTPEIYSILKYAPFRYRILPFAKFLFFRLFKRLHVL